LFGFFRTVLEQKKNFAPFFRLFWHDSLIPELASVRMAANYWASSHWYTFKSLFDCNSTKWIQKKKKAEFEAEIHQKDRETLKFTQENIKKIRSYFCQRN
jgi:hypothetical protein